MPRNDEPTRRMGPNETQEIVNRENTPDGRVDPLIGEVIGGRYKLLAPLGRGGFGHVYRSRDQMLDRIVAVKLMRDPSGTPDHEARARALREMRANARLQHPNIVTLHDAGEDARGLYLVLEYVAGTSLEAVLASGPLSTERTAEILRECALALAAAHTHGIVHRDIKPANILLTENGHVKIADFGIARLIGESHTTDRGLIVGTPNYMAPEQIDGRGVGPAADVFELGCVAYEMICGRPPFRGGTPSEVIGRILRGIPDPLPPLPASVSPLVDLVTQMLRRTASERPLPTTIVQAIDNWRVHDGDRRSGPLSRIDWRLVTAAAAVILVIVVVALLRPWERAGAAGEAEVSPSPTVVEAAPPDRSAPAAIARTSVTFSNRDGVFRFLDYLGRDRDGVKRLDDLTLQLDGPARQVAARAAQARVIDALPGYHFEVERSLFRDGAPSTRLVTVELERTTASEVVDLFAWATGWPVVQRGDFLALSSKAGALRVEARAQPWDAVVAAVLEHAGAEAVQFESAWVIVPKGSAVQEPIRALAVYQETLATARVEAIAAAEAPGGVVLRDETSTPHGVIVVAPSRAIAAARNRLASDRRDGWRIVEPRVFGGEPISLRTPDAPVSELAALAGGAPALDPTARVATTVLDVPRDELLAIARAAAVPHAVAMEPVDAHVTISNRPAKFYAPLAILAGPDATVDTSSPGIVSIRAPSGDARSLSRVIAAIDAMLAQP